MSSINIFYLEGNLINCVFSFLHYDELVKITLLNRLIYNKVYKFINKYKKSFTILYERPSFVITGIPKILNNNTFDKVKLCEILKFCNPYVYNVPLGVYENKIFPYYTKDSLKKHGDPSVYGYYDTKYKCYTIHDKSIIICKRSHKYKYNVYLDDKFSFKNNDFMVFQLRDDIDIPIKYIYFLVKNIIQQKFNRTQVTLDCGNIFNLSVKLCRNKDYVNRIIRNINLLEKDIEEYNSQFLTKQNILNKLISYI